MGLRHRLQSCGTAKRLTSKDRTKRAQARSYVKRSLMSPWEVSQTHKIGDEMTKTQALELVACLAFKDRLESFSERCIERQHKLHKRKGGKNYQWAMLPEKDDSKSWKLENYSVRADVVADVIGDMCYAQSQTR